VERYEKRVPTKNGKIPPQQLWMDLLAESVNTCPPHLKHHLQTMANLDNVPRKEKQFRNFTSNSLNLHKRESEAIVQEIWLYLKQLKDQQVLAKKETADEIERQKLAAVQSTKDDDLVQNEERNSTSLAIVESSTPIADVDAKLLAKAVEKAMRRVLKQQQNKSMQMKRLRKAVKKELATAKVGKDKLKELIKTSASTKGFVLESKTVRLQVD
jgi:hypothetical protein